MAFDYDNCDKNQLDEYASTLGLTLDLRKSIKTLIEETKAAESALAVPREKAAVKDVPRWLKHPVNGRIFEYTDALFEYGLIPCAGPDDSVIESTATVIKE
jgi:hypothetical protein